MHHGFQIQLGHPKIMQESFEPFVKVKDVFQDLFREDEESIYLFWDSVPLRFRYKQDLAENFDNILAMVRLIERMSKGGTTAELHSQLFTVELELHWLGKLLKIKAVFREHTPEYKIYADFLNKRSLLEVSRERFLSEWHTLLHQIVCAFRAGEIVIEDGTERRKLELLQTVDERIKGFGSLYEN